MIAESIRHLNNLMSKVADRLKWPRLKRKSESKVKRFLCGNGATHALFVWLD